MKIDSGLDSIHKNSVLKFLETMTLIVKDNSIIIDDVAYALDDISGKLNIKYVIIKDSLREDHIVRYDLVFDNKLVCASIDKAVIIELKGYFEDKVDEFIDFVY